MATEETGDESAEAAPGKVVKRVLFTRHNSYPQKKVLTFPKHRKDFEVRVNYGDVSFLDDNQQQLFGEKFGGKMLATATCFLLKKASWQFVLFIISIAHRSLVFMKNTVFW